MFRFVSKRSLSAAVAVAFVLATSSIAAAQGADGYRNATRLGGSTSFYKPPLTTPASLKKMAANKKVAADLAVVLEKGGVSSVADKVMAALTSPTEVVKGASCAEASPVDGTVVECDFQPGATLQWMAFKPRVKGKPTPSLLENIRWSGKKPFKAFLFRVTTDDKIYTFVVPKLCGNLSLASTVDVAKVPAQINVDRACTPDGKLTVTVKATGDLSKVGRVRVSINGSPAGELTAPSWSMTSDKPGTYTFDATDKNGKTYPVARSSATIEPCPAAPPPPQVVNPTCSVTVTAIEVKGGYELTIDGSRSSTGTSEIPAVVAVEVYDPLGKMVWERKTLDQSGIVKLVVPRKPAGTYSVKALTSVSRPGVVGNKDYRGEATCEASFTPIVPDRVPSFFVDAAYGKERRERPYSEKYDDPAALGLSPDATFGQCTPLLGLKVGYAKPLQNNWEVAGTVGVAIPVTSDDDKVTKTQMLVEVEANKYMENGFMLGTGLSLWDITRGETFTPGWLVHFGVPLNKGSKTPVYFLGEGRLFFDNIDNIDNNYMFWGGIRVHFPTR
jgi:hypothetical protein